MDDTTPDPFAPQEANQTAIQAIPESAVMVAGDWHGNTDWAIRCINTCIAVGPDTNEQLQPITGHLRLL